MITRPQRAPGRRAAIRRRPRAVILLVLAALVNAAAGIALGIALTPDDPPALPAPPPRPPETVAADEVAATLPQGWRPLEQAPEVTGFEGAGPAAARGPSADIVFAVVPPESPTLLPRTLLDAAGGDVPTPEAVQIDGREALRYPGLLDGRADYVAVPTSAGVALIACVAERPATPAGSCVRPLDAVRIGSAAPIAADERAAFAIALPAAVGTLNRARADGRRTLARQTTPRGRARVSRRLARTYRATAQRLAPLAGEARAPNAVLGMLTRLADHHAALAVASFRRRPTVARRANRRIRVAERRLARALGNWSGPARSS